MRYLNQIENSLAIFCMATYGEGDPTDNAQEFFEWLQSSAGELKGLNYAVSLLKDHHSSCQLLTNIMYFKGFWFGQQDLRALQRNGKIC